MISLELEGGESAARTFLKTWYLQLLKARGHRIIDQSSLDHDPCIGSRGPEDSSRPLRDWYACLLELKAK